MATAKVTKRTSSSKGERLQVRVLKTQQDGRIFAMDVLQRLQNANPDQACLYPFGMGLDAYEHGAEVKPFRTGPQWAGFYRDLSRLIRNGNDEVVKGFASVFTDVLSGDANMGTWVKYREADRAGKFLPFGTPGREYPLPRVMSAKETAKQRAKLERDSKEALDRADKAKLPNLKQIDRREPELIESFLTANGATRRTANAFLVKPYADMARQILRDKSVATCFAGVAAAIADTYGHYLTIATNLEQAERNMKAAIRARPDGEKIIAAARKATT